MSWEAFAWVHGGSGSVDSDGDGVLEPTDPYPQYTAVRSLRLTLEDQGKLAPARLAPYRGPVGVVQGTITRSDTGEPVKYATVYTDGYEFGGPSLSDGMYVVSDVPVGTYTLGVEKVGYQPTSTQITVTENQTTEANFSLVYTGKVSNGIYFVDNSAGSGSCPGCDLFDGFLGQTFRTPPDVGFIKFVAAKPNVGDLYLRFTIIDGDNPDGPIVGEIISYYLEPAFGSEMIGGEAESDGIPVEPDHTYFLKIERTDGQGLYCYASNADPYPDGIAWVGNTPRPDWDLYGTIRGLTVAVVTATGSVAGTVKDTGNNPIANATVTASPGGHSVTSNANGQYNIPGVPVGTYSVTASRSGYSSQTHTGVQVLEDQTTTVNFTLQQGPTTGTITGWVKDTSNNPLSGATVETTTGGYSTTTDGTGDYTLSNVIAGTYTVRASKSGYLTEQQPAVVVTAGQTTTVNFNLAPQEPFSGILNGDFEGGFYNDPDGDHRSGNNWHRFASSGFSKSGGDYGVYHSSHWSQAIWESSWIAGVFQQASNATVGGTYTGRVWARGADITFWIGIDPAGSTDAASANVVWSSAAAPGDAWTQISVEVTAEASTMTLFIKAQNAIAANRNAFVDDAELEETYVPPPPAGPADFDQDGDVDTDDYATLEACYTGPNGTIPPDPPNCDRCDLDRDNDVDLVDFETLQTYIGAAEPPSPSPGVVSLTLEPTGTTQVPLAGGSVPLHIVCTVSDGDNNGLGLLACDILTDTGVTQPNDGASGTWAISGENGLSGDFVLVDPGFFDGVAVGDDLIQVGASQATYVAWFFNLGYGQASGIGANQELALGSVNVGPGDPATFTSQLGYCKASVITAA